MTLRVSLRTNNSYKANAFFSFDGQYEEIYLCTLWLIWVNSKISSIKGFRKN